MKAWQSLMQALLRRAPLAFAAAVLAGLTLLAISEFAYRHSSRTMETLGGYGAARVNVERILKRVLEAESGQRGYLLTGRAEYLAPLRTASREVEQRIGELEAHYYGDAQLTAAVRDLEDQVRMRLSEIETVLQLREEGRDESWKALLDAGIGRERMEQVARITTRLFELESARIAEGRKTVFDTLFLNRAGVLAMTAISLLALFLYLRQSLALEAQREENRRQALAERDRLEVEVRRRTRQLTGLTQHLQTVREDERSRLARELHDELGALLTAAKLDAARIRSRLGSGAPEALERLAHLVETLNQGIALKRRIIEDLHPSSLTNLGLVPALEVLAREFGERAGIAINCAAEPVQLKPADQLTAFRLVQEALTNVARHAHAKTVDISLAARGARVELEVHDDGRGFDTARQPESAHGLTGMRYRVEASGGELDIVSAPGRGTRIRAWLPAGPDDAEAARAET
ncbi:CHASE3 domain-containing protein [Quisquiliibacterium transsilvanicum]|uniref:Signal transduction histidine kinase n=1 Tax=Quisquiliibacterium transsilvanicum TaxID=1549638 RepID=A0A7W8HI71_9BURK|nr:CHASE3 domain-containing protein [Quisquiliibacterium transsilvanicum]MBB5272524.1 signal transduction histidine kinase [Quisquiliibacterium transsilvanicum]